MFIVTHRKWFYILSGVLVLASLVALTLWGLNLGIDFKGGALLEVVYAKEAPSIKEIETKLSAVDIGTFSVRPTESEGEAGYIIRMKEITEVEHQKILAALGATTGTTTSAVQEKRFDSIGPLLGKEAAMKSFWAIGLVLLVIILFIAFAFRKVSEPVSSWKYGIVAIVALAHDVLIPSGVFAVLGRFYGYEVDTLFVTALLVVLGFSIHDTIVVFDRIREHLRVNRELRQHKQFDEVVGDSVKETMARSINTSLTTLLVLLVLYFVGPETTKLFSLALIIGIIAGTYSSIFLASPLLVTLEKRSRK